jgi:hypothetical protein
MPKSMETTCVMAQAFWAVISTMVRKASVLGCSKGGARVAMRTTIEAFEYC